LKIELLPAPLGPMIDRISPFSTAKLTGVDRFQAAEMQRQIFGAEIAHRFRSDLT
jgi:hypothetical protein